METRKLLITRKFQGTRPIPIYNKEKPRVKSRNSSRGKVSQSQPVRADNERVMHQLPTSNEPTATPTLTDPLDIEESSVFVWGLDSSGQLGINTRPEAKGFFLK